MLTNSYSQRNATGNLSTHELYVGSTPCDPFIKSLLKIPGNKKCEFIKWELSLSKSITSSDTFLLTALFGESQPNTNGFMGGGDRIMVKGKYTTSYGIKNNPKAKVYYLTGDEFLSAVILIQMDNNILHFADANKNLLVGNGGWGYVLNRIKQ
jgi:hypothetical protein